jgi:ABC-type enterochelin transport system substrate-binding protein
MKKATIAIAAFALVLTFGCKNNNATTSNASSQQPVATEQAQTQNNLTPEQLGEIGAKIKKNPSDANKILADHGLDQASFEKAIRQVASDPAASRRYRDAYKKSV